MAGWANFGALLTVDTAFYQGDYHPDGNVSGVIVNVARGNQGSYSETTWGARQVTNAISAGKDWGGYFFNGNLDPYTCGVLFGHTLAALGFDPSRNVVGVDCEDEGSTGTHAWGPAEVAAFINGVASVIRGLTWANVLVYMNDDVNHRFDWSAIEAYGARLWFARPGVTGNLGQAYWAVVTMKQDGLYNCVDADGYNEPYSQIIGTPHTKGTQLMSSIITVPDWGGACFIVNPGWIKYVPTTQEVGMFCSLENQQLRTVGVADGSFQAMLQAYLLPITADTAKALVGAGVNYYVAPWADTRSAGVTITDEQLAKIGASVPVPKIPTKYIINGEADAA